MCCLIRKQIKLLATAIFIMLLPAVVFAQQATIREYPYLYKSPRAMGMGGAYTAIGGTVDTLFYNPAGLSTMPRDKGWEVNILNLSLEAGDDVFKFTRNFNSALNASDTPGDPDGTASDEQLRAMNDVLARYRGENLHARVADFTSFGKGSEKLSFGFGALGSGRLDFMTHQGFGPEGFLEVNADVTYGAVGGLSFGLGNNLYAGVSAKILHRELLLHNFSARELIANQDSLDHYILNELRKSGNAVAFDAGAIWKFAQNSRLRPSVGISVLNAPSLNFGDAGKVPMTLNTGISVNPTIPVFRSLIVGIDYVDVLNNYDQDKDKRKRLRYGAELQLFDKLLTSMAVRAGMYEGYPTVGLDVRIAVVKVSYVAYAEEIGAYAGQDRDKRQMLTLEVGW